MAKRFAACCIKKTITTVRAAIVALLTLGLLPGSARADLPTPHSECVRALLVADTDSGLPGLSKDLDTIQSLLEPLRAENRCSIDVLRGADVSKDRILTWVNDQADASSDTVFIYYTGHGATDMPADPDPSQQTLGNYLALTHGPPLFRSTLRKKLAQCKARLTILITDSCSNVVSVKKLAARLEMEPKLARSLFLEPLEIVDFTSARFDPQTGVGESAIATDDGSVFTTSFCKTLNGARFADLDKDNDGHVTWAEVFPLLREATDNEYRAMRALALSDPDSHSPKAVESIREQPHLRPWAFCLGSWDSSNGIFSIGPPRKWPVEN